MNRKWLSVLLALILVAGCALGCAGCTKEGKTEQNQEQEEQEVALEFTFTKERWSKSTTPEGSMVGMRGVISHNQNRTVSATINFEARAWVMYLDMNTGVVTEKEEVFPLSTQVLDIEAGQEKGYRVAGYPDFEGAYSVYVHEVVRVSVVELK